MKRGCPFCRDYHGSHGHAVGACGGFMLAASRRGGEITSDAAAAWKEERFYRFGGSMKTCGMLELRVLLFDEMDKIIEEFCGQYDSEPRYGAIFGFGGNPEHFPVGWRRRWKNLEALQWMVWERARGEREGPGPFYQSEESALGGVEEGWTYGFIPGRVIKWAEDALRKWGKSQSEKVEVRKLLRPWLLRLHGTLVVGCYALMVMYEAEVVEWCKQTNLRYDMGFFRGDEEETDGEEEEGGAEQLLTQQCIKGGAVGRGDLYRGVLCDGSSSARSLGVGADICPV